MTNLTKICFLIGMGCAAAAQGASIVVLDPADGAASGLPGTDVGWGFTLYSDPHVYLSAITSGLLGETNPAVGYYTDFIGPQGGPVLGFDTPGLGAWTEAFDDVSRGVGSFSIAPGTPLGAVDSGIIEIQIAMYSRLPIFCGGCSLGTETIDLPFRVTVTPEPESAWLGLCGLATAAWLGKRRRGKESDQARGPAGT